LQLPVQLRFSIDCLPEIIKVIVM